MSYSQASIVDHLFSLRQTQTGRRLRRSCGSGVPTSLEGCPLAQGHAPGAAAASGQPAICRVACGGPVLPVLHSVYRACSPWNFHSQAASCNSAHCRWWKWSSSALGRSEQRVRGRETKPGAHCFLLGSSVQRQLNPLSLE